VYKSSKIYLLGFTNAENGGIMKEPNKSKYKILKIGMCVFIFDKNTDALLLHTYFRIVKAFVWRQIGVCVFRR
jgi:hypothetical protein